MNFDEFEFVIYVYNNYNIDPGEASNIVSISNDSPDYEIQPNIILEYYKHNRSTLENVFELRRYLGLDSCIDEVLDALDEIKVETKNKIAIDEVIDEIKEQINERLKKRLKKLR